MIGPGSYMADALRDVTLFAQLVIGLWGASAIGFVGLAAAEIARAVKPR